jgi:transmembrane sensor
VLVTEGVVETWTAGEADNRVRLGAGQRAIVSKASVIRVDTAGLPALDQALTWRDGRIDLGGKSLADAIDEFNRYNKRQIVLCDSSLAAEQFDGVFNTNDPEGFATAVQASLNVPVELDQPDRIRIGAKCD